MVEAEAIIKLWNDGLTATQIGDRFGTTRSSILGKISRLRAKGALIERRASPLKAKMGQGSGKPRKQKDARDAPAQLRFDVLFEHEFCAKPTPEPEPVVRLFNSNGVSLFDLKRDDCHYIIGRDDDAYLYCGAPSHRRSMCKSHHKICYYTPKV